MDAPDVDAAHDGQNAEDDAQRLGARLRRQGVLVVLALEFRHRLIPGGSRREEAYLRLLRPLGRRLLRPTIPIPRVTQTAGPPTQHAAAAGVDASRILVLKLDHLGDFVVAAPAFALLRRGAPLAHITLVCAPPNAGLAAASGWFDQVVPLAGLSVRPGEAAANPATLGAALHGMEYDIAIDLRLDSDTRPLLAQVPARQRAGYPVAGVVLDIAPATRPVHQRAALMVLIGAVLARIATPGLLDFLRRPLPASLAGLPRPLVAISPGSGAAIRNWPAERFAAVARHVCGRLGGSVVLLGGADQAPAGCVVRAAEPHAVNMIGSLDVADSLAVLAACDGFVGNDSGLGHAAGAFGVASVVVFAGPESFARWQPRGPASVAIKVAVACAPCHLLDSDLCPNGRLCLTAIDADAVTGALDRLLQRERA